MFKSTMLAVMLLLLLTIPPGQSSPPPILPAEGEQPFKIGDRDEPDLDQLHVITKTFLVGMRRHHGDANANALRHYFDPRYLKKHNLIDKDLHVELAAV